MKLKKVFGLILSAAMAVTAVVPWTGMTVYAKDKDACKGHNVKYVVCDDENSGGEELSSPKEKIYCGGSCDAIDASTSFTTEGGESWFPDATVLGKDGMTAYELGCSCGSSVTVQGNTVEFHYAAAVQPPEEADVIDEIRFHVSDALNDKLTPTILSAITEIRVQYEDPRWGMLWYPCVYDLLGDYYWTRDVDLGGDAAMTVENYMDIIKSFELFVTLDPHVTYTLSSPEVVDIEITKDHHTASPLEKNKTILNIYLDTPSNPPASEQKIIVNFNAYDHGAIVDAGEYASYTLSSKTPSAEILAPEVTANEGWSFDGWTGNLGGAKLADKEEFCFNDFKDLVTFDADGVGYIGFTANFKDNSVNPGEGKTLRIYWAIDNPEGAEWVMPGYGSDAWTETIAWSDKDNTFVMPGLTVKDGYELKGWSVSGTQGNYWDSNTSTFGLTGLIVEDENGGYVSITANVVAKQPEEADRIYVTFNQPWGDAKDAVLFQNAEGEYTQDYFTVETDRGTSVSAPSIKVAEGYEFVGWQYANSSTWFKATDVFTEDYTALFAVVNKVVDPNPPYIPDLPDEDINDDNTPIAPPAAEEEIEDEETPLAPGGDTSGEEIGDEEVPLVPAPQTGGRAFGSLALLTGSAIVALVSLKKRK